MSKIAILLRESSRPFIAGPTVATIGNFDGLHRGHQQLVQAVVQEKQGGGYANSIVVSFYPHPVTILRGEHVPPLLPVQKRLQVLGALGLDYLYLMRFSRALAELSAEEFLENFIIKRLNVKSLIVGPDATVGKARKGDVAFIRSFLEPRGISVSTIPWCNEGQAKIGSAAVREALLAGNVLEAEKLLGRPYCIEGRVLHGDARGASIGFATANLATGKAFLPAHGVYAGYTELEGQRYKSLTNIGVRPTVDGKKLSVETHILDFPARHLYGQRLTINFQARLRPEKKFSSLEELKSQIESDIVQARLILRAGE